MDYILHINTALEKAMVGISTSDQILAERHNPIQMEHASFVQPAIKEMMDELSLKWNQLKAVSVINGPGSYTGLRVGLAAAKGICYAWNLPIIPVSTLEWLASPFKNSSYDIMIPMIDARRMEVFSAVYSGKLEVMDAAKAIILNEQSYSNYVNTDANILFTGNGAHKITDSIRNQKNVFLLDSPAGINEQNILCQHMMKTYEHSEIAYLEPFYVKGFHSTLQNSNK